jgi:peptide-methionine (S)-S-oxide reductase
VLNFTRNRSELDDSEPSGAERATFAAGCFWGIEAAFRELEGVMKTTVGYTGGTATDPSYEQVCSGTTGHAEVVQVCFDPAQITFADLLRVFFTTHDPTTKDRQGNDVGPQYRSIILTHSDTQAATAKSVMQEIAAAKLWPAPIVTQIEPLAVFYPAEAEHDDYYARNPWSGYCQVVIAPKVAKARKVFKDRLKQVAAE